MVLGDEHAMLTLIARGDSTEGGGIAGDVHLSAAAVSGNFTASLQSLWVSASAWQLFLGQLRELVDGAGREAHVESMSPADLALHIAVRDSAGHIAATILSLNP
jgi:hypothetical protein